jgi:branched-chain amino acid transport system ATP-binding protein
MTVAGNVLKVDSMTVRFGGLVAVDGLSFEVEDGGLLGIIGPNGAGKTTAFSAIAGNVGLASGHIYLEGQRLDGLRTESVARKGVARTFQSVRLFRRMTVIENLVIAASSVSRSLKAARSKADEIMSTMELAPLAERHPPELPLADQKRVEIARALSLSPRLLLLDEMMSGLNPQESETIVQIVRRLNEAGLTIVLIEHVLDIITSLSDRILVLDHGRLLVEGAPEKVMSDVKVVEAYLGQKAAGKRRDVG